MTGTLPFIDELCSYLVCESFIINLLMFQLNDQGHYAEALMTKGVLAPRGCMEQLKVCIFVPAHKILVLITYVQKPPSNISSGTRGL